MTFESFVRWGDRVFVVASVAMPAGLACLIVGAFVTVEWLMIVGTVALIGPVVFAIAVLFAARNTRMGNRETLDWLDGQR